MAVDFIFQNLYEFTDNNRRWKKERTSFFVRKERLTKWSELPLFWWPIFFRIYIENFYLFFFQSRNASQSFHLCFFFFVLIETLFVVFQITNIFSYFFLLIDERNRSEKSVVRWYNLSFCRLITNECLLKFFPILKLLFQNS
jgi:hypothetical protein